jgi:hypothetical protein
VTVVALVLAVLIAGIGLYVYGPFGNRSANRPVSVSPRVDPSQGPDASGALDPSVPVKVFLQAYALGPYASNFARALETQRMAEVTATIYDQTGYHLIQLTQLPDHIRQRYDVLAYPAAPDGVSTYYLFWKPTVLFPKFYYRMVGKQVRTLQEMLAQIDLYQDVLDGIVGKNLMQAIIQFQEQVDLTVTGYPDPTTIFLLAHHEKRKAQ